MGPVDKAEVERQCDALAARVLELEASLAKSQELSAALDAYNTAYRLMPLRGTRGIDKIIERVGAARVALQG